MKKIFIVFFSFLITSFLYSQIIPESIIRKNNISSSSSFFEIQRAMNDYWTSLNVQNGYVVKNGEKVKVPYWKIYKRWEYYWEQRVNQVTGEFPDKNVLDGILKSTENNGQFKNESDYSENWINLGTNSSAGGYAGLGRINCIAFHPRNTNTFRVGSPSGGIWRTTNGGTNWIDLSNGLVISQVYRIGVSQTNSNLIMTGLQDNGSKLYNSGTWTDVYGEDGLECIIDFSNSNYMYATYVYGEILRSSNGGLSFSTAISANISGGQPTGAWVTPYVINPSNSSTLFAGYDLV